MVDDISYDFIWRFYQREKQTNQLLPTGKNFYDEILEFNTSFSKEQQHTNVEKITVELFEKRKQKIMLYVAYGRNPPSMSNSETEFYTKMVELSNTHTLSLVAQSSKKSKLMRSLKDIPEIMLPSGNKIGPIKKDEIINDPISETDTEYLIQNTICENYDR
jgi:DNA replication initiation complex subunit (GINS family)